MMFAVLLGVLALAAQPDPPPAAEAVIAGPPAEAAAKSLAFEPKTIVDDDTLQVILGQRAVFTLSDDGRPLIDAVEEGRLAAAHPPGAVDETFGAPAAGLVAVALDGSAEKRVTVLKVWNGRAEALDYRAIVLVLRDGNLQPTPVQVCAVPAGGVRTHSWPAPIVAVGLAHFTTPPSGAEPEPGCGAGR